MKGAAKAEAIRGYGPACLASHQKRLAVGYKLVSHIKVSSSALVPVDGRCIREATNG